MNGWDKKGRKLMQCQNCGYDNDEDALFCEKCGSNLKQQSFGRFNQTKSEKEGMRTSTKVLIVVCIVLVVALGITAGALFLNKGTSNNNPVSVNQSSEQVTATADWHQLTSFSGSGDDFRTFQTKGQRFKVVMSATPQLNYNTNFMNVDISGNGQILASGNLNWNSTDALTTKEKTIEVTGSPGTYTSHVTTKDLQSWTVTIYDYY